MDKGFLAVIAIGFLAFAGFAFYASTSSSPAGQNAQAQQAYLQPALGADAPTPPAAPAQVQEVAIHANSKGFTPTNVKVKAGQPVKISFDAESGAGCASTFLIKKAGISLISKNGQKETAQFTPEKGTYVGTCSMAMFKMNIEAS